MSSENADDRPSANEVFGLHHISSDEDASDELVRCVIIVHGITDPDWNDKQKWEQSSWLRSLDFGPIRLMRYCYDFNTDDIDKPGRDWLESIAEDLLDGIVRLREEIASESQETKTVSFFFISFDFGGTIVKKALTIATLNPVKYKLIDFFTPILLFINCPHRSFGLVSLEDQVAKLLLMNRSSFHSNIIRKIRYLAKSLQETNNDFVESKALIRASIWNIFSSGVERVKNKKRIDEDIDEADIEAEDEEPQPQKPKCHERDAATLRKSSNCFSISFEFAFATEQSHSELVDGRTDDGDRLGSDTDFIDALNRSSRPSYAKKMSRILTQANFAHYHQVVLSQAPPLVPPGLELDSSASSATDWILENHTYKSWRQPGVSILHIYGTSGISAVSRNLCEHINADWKDYVDRTHTFFFEFDRYDVRCNNVQAMLSSFMSQMISRYTSLDRMRDDLNSCLELHCAYQSWSMRNIFATFKRVRRRKGPTKAEIIISRLDQCDDSRFWLLDQLALISWYDEQPWRVIITTQNDEKLNEALSKFPGINMDGCPTQGVHNSDVVGLCEKQLAEVIRDRPLLAAHKTKLGELLQECREDVQLAQLLLDCLSHVELGASEVERRELLEALSPVSLASIFQTRLERSNVPTKPWRRDVLRVLKHIVRPVTWNELTFILGLVDGVAQIQPPDIYVDEIAKDVLWAFGMFISVQGHEVRLQRHFLEQTTIPEAESAAAHAEMANRCLDYLGIAAVQKQIQSFCDHYDELSESPLFAPRRNLISYAVMYWTTHYRLAGSEKPFKQACKFFRNPEAKNAWAAAYYTLANPFTRTDRGYKSPLPVVCMTGLEDLVIEFISSEKPLKGFREDCGLALSEAARHGHIGTARLLMKASSPTNRDLQDAITAAASFGHGGALEELLEYASTLNDFQWPPDLVGQVAWHGLDKAAKLLINAGIDINVQKTVDGNTPLHHAAREGHVETLRAMLQADPKPDLTVQNKFGSKPLHQAAVHGHPELIRVLLDAGADIDDTSSQGRTPLQLATSWSKPNAVEVLLDRSAKMDVTQDEEPKSIWNAHPIFSASINGSKRCMEHLLRNEADIKIKYKIGSPLYYAVAEKNLEVARMLLEAGADPNEKPENSDLILILAVEGGNIDMVSLLLEYGARVNEENSDSWRNTALSRAAGTGKEELVRFLIEKGKADVNYYGKYSQPPIYVAAFTCHAGIVQILIDHEADVNVALWGRKWCALHASYDAPEVAKLLLENGAEIDRECDDGTVLFLASLYNKPDVVKVLLNHKPNPPNLEIQRPDDVGDEAGMTALSIACKNHHLKIMRLLLEAGANPNHMTKVGSSPLKLCLKRPAGADKAVKILLEYAPDLDRRDEEGNTVLHDCHRWNRSVARHLVNAGADVRALNKAGQSPLYNAVNSGSTDIVRYLLSKHADPNVQSPNGSLLYVALDWGLDMIRALVEGGANVHSADSSPDNKEGLINTILKRYPDPLDIVKYLVETGGIDINKKRGNLAYPLLTACQRGQADIVRYLLSRGAEPNVVDDLSRRALHLAAISQDSLSALLESNVDVQKYEPEAKGDDETTPPQQQQQQRQPIRDNMSRTPLHFAASSDEPPAFWRVKNMYPDRAAAEPDDKGWTPLFWALRRKYPDREVVAELLKHGRGVWSRAKGPSGGDWSPLKLARYVGAPEEITKMLVPESTKKGRRGEMWEPDEHVSRVATRHYAYCDSCFVTIYGIRWNCLSCDDFDFCFRCYMSRDAIHPDHTFEAIGSEFEEGSSEDLGNATPIPLHREASIDVEDDVGQPKMDEAEGEGKEEEERDGLDRSAEAPEPDVAESVVFEFSDEEGDN